MSASGRRKWLRVVSVTTGIVLAAAVGVAAMVGFGGDSAAESADAEAGPPATATVTRQTLADSETVAGELAYGSASTASAKSNGTITSLPTTGSRIKRGQTLYTIDNNEVVLLYGKLPAYRVLKSGVEGADVEQFEQNLEALGYSGFTVDDEYTSATAEAVQEWQEDLGLPETGRVEQGQILYAAGEVRVDSHATSVGDAVRPGQAVLTYTGTSQLVTVELDVDDQRLAKQGAKVQVGLPDGKSVDGVITKTETVIKTSASSGGQPAEDETKIEVTVSVADSKALAGFDYASVDVMFTAFERKDVLTVPVAALLALAEGGYGVQVVDGDRDQIVAVTTGLFADGRVEISGGGIAEGMTVGMPK